MATFGQLRDTIIAEAGVTDMFKIRSISPAHNAFWDKINEVEYKRGYVPGEYERSGTPALCQMNLLTQGEFDEWVKEFKELPKN